MGRCLVVLGVSGVCVGSCMERRLIETALLVRWSELKRDVEERLGVNSRPTIGVVEFVYSSWHIE